MQPLELITRKISGIQKVVKLIVLRLCRNLLAQGNGITLNEVPESLRREWPPIDVLHLGLAPHGISFEAVGKEFILRAVKKFNWNQTHAAKYLGTSHQTLMYIMEKYSVGWNSSPPIWNRHRPQVSTKPETRLELYVRSQEHQPRMFMGDYGVLSRNAPSPVRSPGCPPSLMTP